MTQDCSIKLWDITSGDLLNTLPQVGNRSRTNFLTFLQDAEISCLSVFPQLPSHILFGDGESKLSLLDLGQGSTLFFLLLINLIEKQLCYCVDM